MPSELHASVAYNVQIRDELVSEEAVIIRLLYMIWALGFLGLTFFAVADTLFGVGSFAIRLANLPYRILVSIVWPFAIVTPRGRYLLIARWRQGQ